MREEEREREREGGGGGGRGCFVAHAVTCLDRWVGLTPPGLMGEGCKDKSAGNLRASEWGRRANHGEKILKKGKERVEVTSGKFMFLKYQVRQNISILYRNWFEVVGLTIKGKASLF